MYMRGVGITHLPPHRESSVLTLANMHYREAPTGSLKTVESGDLFGVLHYLFIFLRVWSSSFTGPASWDWPWEFLQWCRSVASELPSDITLDVDGHKFHLHKVVPPSHPIAYFQSMHNFNWNWLQIYLLLPNSFLCTTHASEDMLMYSNSVLCPIGVLEVLQRPRRCVQFLKFTIPLRCHST